MPAVLTSSTMSLKITRSKNKCARMLMVCPPVEDHYSIEKKLVKNSIRKKVRKHQINYQHNLLDYYRITIRY